VPLPGSTSSKRVSHKPHKVRSPKTRPPRQRAAESPDSPGSTIVAWPWQTPAEAACPPRFDEPVTRAGAAGKRLRILKGMQPFWYLFVRFGWPLRPHRQPASPRPRVFDLPGTPAQAGAAWGMLLGSFGSSSFALLAVFVISRFAGCAPSEGRYNRHCDMGSRHDRAKARAGWDGLSPGVNLVGYVWG
jgi:hypothetical protein